MQRFNSNLNRVNDISQFIYGLLDKYGEETEKLKCHSTRVHEAHAKCIYEFEKAYEVFL